MTNSVTQASTQPPCLRRSIGAVILGFVAVAVLSLGTDQLLHALNVYPPWGEPMHDTRLNLLALSYRIAYTIVGGYITARLAPRNPVRHALILGIVGLVISLVGVIVTIPMKIGPAWYPIAIAVTAVPCTWLGGILYQKSRRDNQPASI